MNNKELDALLSRHQAEDREQETRGKCESSAIKGGRKLIFENQKNPLSVIKTYNRKAIQVPPQFQTKKTYLFRENAVQDEPILAQPQKRINQKFFENFTSFQNQNENQRCSYNFEQEQSPGSLASEEENSIQQFCSEISEPQQVEEEVGDVNGNCLKVLNKLGSKLNEIAMKRRYKLELGLSLTMRLFDVLLKINLSKAFREI